MEWVAGMEWNPWPGSSGICTMKEEGKLILHSPEELAKYIDSNQQYVIYDGLVKTRTAISTRFEPIGWKCWCSTTIFMNRC
jgi:hypothetical protein